MMNESNNLPDLPSNLKKKSYSAMKVSRLGSLTDLTQRSGAYAERRGGYIRMQLIVQRETIIKRIVTKNNGVND
jgi:hypothetical protein